MISRDVVGPQLSCAGRTRSSRTGALVRRDVRTRDSHKETPREGRGGGGCCHSHGAPRSWKTPRGQIRAPHPRLLASKLGEIESLLFNPSSWFLPLSRPDRCSPCPRRPRPWSHHAVPSARPEGWQGHVACSLGGSLPTLRDHIAENPEPGVYSPPHPTPRLRAGPRGPVTRSSGPLSGVQASGSGGSRVPW